MWEDSTIGKAVGNIVAIVGTEIADDSPMIH
jgi:hypothetical protein